MKELQAQLSTGSTLYAILLNSVGQVWNGAAFETVNGANWATYDIALTESVAGLYTADMPAVDAGVYSYVVYEQAGASPANTDEWTGNGYLEWDGTAVLPISTIDTNVDDIETILGTPANFMADVSALGTPDNFKADVSALGTGVELSAQAIDDILDEVIVDTYTMRQLIKFIATKMHGLASGGGTTTIKYAGLDERPAVVIETVDENGNRSNVVLKT